MAIFKCKMCGGALEISEDITVAECEYCGSKQTVPTKKDEVITNLFNRANNLRLKSEFDKAAEVYSKILNENDADAEAHWGLVLCKYGIEYVEDPKTYKRIPTCHRTQYTSVLSDTDYLAAIENADVVSKEVYTAEAHEIAELQKSILAIVKDEKPFDVFICYKETDENGKRTVDSTLANDIYYQLTKEGLRVFYAAITLEDKLGVEYEPYIFAALNSAKVMLVIGTKPEYFNAVWVRNEWSRYLGIMKTDREKMLIPCYRDMDAYDLPEEFAHLQAQDMSKIGFINDLVRGIKKVTVKDVPKATENTVKETVVKESSNGNIDALLKRGFMALEDGEWGKADDFFEQVLNFNAELADAYLGKLMAELGVKNQGALKDQAEPFDKSNNYQKVLRFGDESLKSMLVSYIDHINTRNENAREEKRKDEILSKGNSRMSHHGVYHYEAAIKLFETIPGWKDADEKIAVCQKKIEELNAEAEQKRIELEKTKKQTIKILKIATPVACVLIIIALIMNNVVIPSIKYNKAVKLVDNGEYSEAYYIFNDIYGYKDSADYHSKFKFNFDKTTHKYVDSDGDITTYEYTYDSNGILIKEMKDYDDHDSYSSDYTDTYEYTYDSSGNLIKKIHTDEDWDTVTNEYTYDSNGNLIKEIQTDEDGDTATHEYTYDSNDNMLKDIYINWNGVRSINRYKYTYDSKGILIKKVSKNSDGDVTCECTYDSKGNKIKEVSTEQDGDITTYEYTYDNNGNIIKKIKKIKDYKYTSYYNKVYYYEEYALTNEYLYDSNGNLIKNVSTNKYDETYTYEYSYDGNGNLIKKIYSNEYDDTDTYQYIYDVNGIWIKEIQTDEDGNITTINYSYDEKGNVIQRTNSYGASIIYTYDINGNLIEEINKDKYGDITASHKYTYEGEHITYDPDYQKENNKPEKPEKPSIT